MSLKASLHCLKQLRVYFTQVRNMQLFMTAQNYLRLWAVGALSNLCSERWVFILPHLLEKAFFNVSKPLSEHEINTLYQRCRNQQMSGISSVHHVIIKILWNKLSYAKTKHYNTSGSPKNVKGRLLENSNKYRRRYKFTINYKVHRYVPHTKICQREGWNDLSNQLPWRNNELSEDDSFFFRLFSTMVK